MMTEKRINCTLNYIHHKGEMGKSQQKHEKNRKV